MNLQIERPYVDAMIAEFPRLAPLKDQLRFGNKVTMPFQQRTLIVMLHLKLHYYLWVPLDDIALRISTGAKGLTKLAAKYCNQKRVQPNAEVFKRCSVFRGMELDRSAQ